MSTKYSDLNLSVKMRLFSLQKRQVVLVFLGFFASFFVCINVGLLGPTMLDTITTSVVNQSNNINLKSGPFVFVTPYLSQFHQKLWINAKPIITGRKEDFSKQFTLNIHIHENDKQTDRTGAKMEYFNRTRYLHCKDEVCDVFSVLHLDHLHAEQYTFELKIFGLDDSVGLDIKDILFTFNSYNPQFTRLELCFRFFFLFRLVIGTKVDISFAKISSIF